MKKKFIEFEDYSQHIKPSSQWSFGSVSPFPQVSTPKALFVAYAGAISPISGPSIAMETLDICRFQLRERKGRGWRRGINHSSNRSQRRRDPMFISINFVVVYVHFWGQWLTNCK